MLPLINKFSIGLLSILDTCNKAGKLMESNKDLAEIISRYEKLCSNSTPQQERAISRHIVYEDSEQRSTVFPNTRRILFVQTRINAKSYYIDPRPRCHSCKHVRRQSGPVRPRKGILHCYHGRGSN